MRTILDWNDNWQCRRTADGPDALFAAVTLPHTWNAVDGQDGGNDYYRGTYEYAKTFARPRMEKEERLFLEVPAAANSAVVTLNGQVVGTHDGGYSAFRFDLTDGLQDENTIVITVDNSASDSVYPQKADFTFYGGLYRGVKLIIVPAEHFELIKYATPGIKITPAVDLTTGAAKVRVETWQNAREVSVTILGEGAGETKSQTKIAASVDGRAEVVFVLDHARLWDGVNDPYLYTARATLSGGDEVSVRFGIRDIKITSEGFFLNGKSYPLRGVSKHQDRGGVGNAVTNEMLEEDMAIVKEIGANSVRLAHYQHPQYFYDLCDEYGIIAWAEVPYISEHMTNGRENVCSQMKELITQCYNHPCICCWGLSNEITAASKVTDELLEVHRKLNDLVHQMDATRPTTMAHVFMLETDSPLTSIADTGAYNLYFGWYLGTLDQNEKFFDAYHEKFPDRAIGFSEYGADTNPAFHSSNPESGDYTEEYQCVYHEHILKVIEERPYLWCTYVWNLFDFGADGRDEGGEHGKNQKGLVTIDRKVRKDAFYLYKATWSSEPFVHICGRRYVNRPEHVTNVKVYSNQPVVTLYVDGAKVETQEGSKVFNFRVPIRGEHVIEARAEISSDIGSCLDTITVKRVSMPDPAYRLQKQEAVVNWFDRDTLFADCFSVEDTLGEMMAHPKANAIVRGLIDQASKSRGDVAQAANSNENLFRMMAGMKLTDLLKKAGGAISPEQIKALNDALQKISKTESGGEGNQSGAK